MLFPSLERDAHGSPYGEQLRAGYSGLRFDAGLEKDFRDYYLEFSMRRVQLGLVIAMAVLFAVIALDFLISSQLDATSANPLRLTVLFPLLALGLIVTLHPDLRAHHQLVFGTSALVFGAVIGYMSVITGLHGAPHEYASLVVFVFYVYLFLGLLFHTALLTSSVVVLAYIAMAAGFGLPGEVLFYQSALLFAACAVGGVGAYTFEHAVRTSYLESRMLSELAQRDGLTGLYNRRLFDDQMSRIWRQARRAGAPVQIILVDIDYFKVFNDLYGHQAGDDCLRRVANTLNAAAKRPFDLCARYGGEEFVLVVSDPPRDYAETLPERLRREVAALGVPHEGSPVAEVVTVSIGVAVVTPGEGRSLAGAVQMADEALYQAKEEGRNRVVFRESFSSVTTGSFRAHRNGSGHAAA